MDLWATPDNIKKASQNTTSAAAWGRSGTRHLTDRAILSLLRNWLLQDFVATYCRSLAATRIFRRCYWIDALGSDTRKSLVAPILPEVPTAQSSRKAKGRVKEEMSALPPALRPIVLLSQALEQSEKPITLYGLILADGSSKRPSPRAVPLDPARMGSVKEKSGIIQANWLEASSIILKEVEQSPSILLLNPLGATPFSHNDLQPLYQRTMPTELCLLISHHQIEARLKAAEHDQKQATALTALLRSDRWRTLAIRAGDPGSQSIPSETITGFIELLQSSMKRHFQLAPQKIAFPLIIGPATIADAPYTLIYATRRQDSLLNMNDAVCLYRRRLYQYSYQGVLGEEWFAQQEQERRASELEQLSQHIQQQGHTQRIRRWPDLRQNMINSHFGQWTQAEYDMLIRQLLSNQEVRCMWRRTPAATEERTPDNHDTLIWR